MIWKFIHSFITLCLLFWRFLYLGVTCVFKHVNRVQQLDFIADFLHFQYHIWSNKVTIFAVTAPQLWNQLMLEIKGESRLKTTFSLWPFQPTNLSFVVISAVFWLLLL